MKETQIMIDDSIESVEENVVDLLIPEALLLSPAEIAKHAEDVNCSLPEELFFCKRMPRGSRKKNGAVNLNGQIVIYLEQKEWLEKARELIDLHAEIQGSETDVSIDVLNRIAFLSYLKTYLARTLPPEHQELNLYFVFYQHVGSEIEIAKIAAIRGHLIAQVNKRFTEDFFRFKKYNPYKIIKRLDRFYRVY
jgi:hypothetical protein